MSGNSLTMLILVVLVFLLSTNAFAATDWRGGTDTDWFNAANWFGGAVGVPTSAEWADLRSATWVPNQPVISGTGAVALHIRINAYAAGPLSTLTVNSGDLTVQEAIYIGNSTAEKNGELIINGGTVTVGTFMLVGQDAGNGVLRMNGGTVNAGVLGVPRWWTTGTGTGCVYLDGGIINCSTNLIIGENSFIDISYGILILDSDGIVAIQEYVADGRIIAYGGRGNVEIDTNINLGKVTVTGQANLGKAWGPNPDHQATAQVLAPILTWASGDYVQEVNAHEIYFGTDFDSVAKASVYNPLGVYKGAQNHDADSYSTGLLELGQVYYWRIDEVNENHVDERWKGDVWQLVIDSGVAQKPSPVTTTTGVEPNAILSWSGHYATSYDVYLGASFDDVNSGTNILSIDSGVYKGNQPAESNSYGPCDLNFGQIYYWRIDEITDVGITRGGIWNFTVTENIVDNFESYDDTGGLLTKWVDESGNATGSTISLYTLGNSMEFKYDNSITGWYSEAELTFSTTQDWSGIASEALSLRFRGSPSNSNDQLYLLLSDGDVNGVVKFGDVDAVKEDAWQIWNIDLDEFDDQEVNLANIEKLAIGFGDRNNPQAGGSGTIYLDDIILYPARCLTIYQSDLDLNGDCVIDLLDLLAISQDWLISDYNILAVEPNDNRLLLYYKFDETSGVTIGHDETGSYDATVDVNGANAWDSYGYNNGCLYFDGTLSVSVPSDAFVPLGNELTISVWVNADVNIMLDRLAKVQFSAGSDTGIYDQLNWTAADANDHSGRWNHYAFVKHASQGTMHIYHNGKFVAQNLNAFKPLDGLAAGVTKIGVDLIGTNYYRGKIDELKIYNYALSQSEIAYLVLGGEGQIHQPIEPILSKVDLTGDGKIDLIDYSVLAKAWLMDSLWP